MAELTNRQSCDQRSGSQSSEQNRTSRCWAMLIIAFVIFCGQFQGAVRTAQAADEAQLYLKNPDDSKAFTNFYRKTTSDIALNLARRDFEATERGIANTADVLTKAKPTTARGEQDKQRAMALLQNYRVRLTAAQAKFKELFDQLRKNADDVKTLDILNNKLVYELGVFAASRPQPTLVQLAQVDSETKALEPKTSKAKRRLLLLRANISRYQTMASASTLSKDELVAKIKADPKVARVVLSTYTSKVYREVRTLARTNPEKAEEECNQLRALVDQYGGVSKETLLARVKLLSEAIAGARRMKDLIGSPGAKLDDLEWVNGGSLRPQDVKGKVVVLDFVAVWSGLFQQQLPQLKKWHRDHADQGLVIIGMTTYYNYKWDDKRERPVRVALPVEHRVERQMLAKYAVKNKLPYRLAIESSLKTLHKYYAAIELPHLVVIDRRGKIRFAKSGVGRATNREVSLLLAKLLAEK